jgi:RNA polymerase sigma-70 factor (TIGR02960 family)
LSGGGDIADASRSEAAFRELVAPHRGVLRAHCYRMLGSLSDADDAVQEAMIAAWQGFAAFEGRSAVRTWLHTIATRVCLRIAEQRRRRVSPEQHAGAADPRAELGAPLDEATFVEPWVDADDGWTAEVASPEARYSQLEAVELAFVVALQVLPATQRSVLLLRDVVGLSAREVADAQGTSVAAVNSAHQRARATLDEVAPAASQLSIRRALGQPGHRELVERFVAAWERADVDAIVAMMTSDATFTMPPLPTWFRGVDDIRVFLEQRVFRLAWRFRVASANGQPAFLAYERSADTGRYQLSVLNVVTLRGDRVSGITSFLDEAQLSRLGFPATVSA